MIFLGLGEVAFEPMQRPYLVECFGSAALISELEIDV